MNLIPISDVLKKTGASRGFVAANVRAGRFPPPLKLGPRKRAWVEAEITAWLAERVADRSTGANEVKA